MLKIAVGGRDEDDEAVTAIHLYQLDATKQVKVPSPRFNCTCAMTADREVLVAGGRDGNGLWEHTKIQ